MRRPSRATAQGALALNARRWEHQIRDFGLLQIVRDFLGEDCLQRRDAQVVKELESEGGTKSILFPLKNRLEAIADD